MILFDVNVLLWAQREELEHHRRAKAFVDGVLAADTAFGVSELVLSAVVRISTHPSIFSPPTPLARALDFAAALRDAPTAVVLGPGPRHWRIFDRLCRESNAKGNIVPDAYLAALAIETGSTLVTTDRGFTRFPGLGWENPLEGSG